MGDRGNIAIELKRGEPLVYFYTHHGGSEVTQCLAKSLARGRNGDPSYLARVIFDDLKGEDVTSTTGFGITLGEPDDNEYPIPVVRWRQSSGSNRLVVEYQNVDYTADEFIKFHHPDNIERLEIWRVRQQREDQLHGSN